MEEVIFEVGALKVGRKEGERIPGREDSMGTGLEARWACASHECCMFGVIGCCMFSVRLGWEKILER